MRKITLNMADNPRGADPVVGLYAAINRSWASLGLNRTNSTIAKIQHFASVYEPDRTLVKIVRKSAPFTEYLFTYNRFKITRYINNPIWNPTDLTQVKTLDSKALLARIALKLNLNLTPADFFIEEAGILYTGGQARPNWRLKARFDSIYWYGHQIVWLHDGSQLPEPEPEPEPGEGGATQLFPIVNIAKPGSGAWTINTAAHVGKTIMLEGVTGGAEFGMTFTAPQNGLTIGSEIRILNMMDGDAIMNIEDFGIWHRPDNGTLWRIRHYYGDLIRLVVVNMEDGHPQWGIVGYFEVVDTIGV